MGNYLRILFSIIAALLSLAMTISVAFGFSALVFGSPDNVQVVFFPFALAWVGFVMFGIIGSVFWFVFLALLDKVSLEPMKRHILAACLSIVTSWVTIALAMSGGGFKRLPEAAFVLIFIVPVAAVSLFWYWLLYLRPESNKINHGNG